MNFGITTILLIASTLGGCINPTFVPNCSMPDVAVLAQPVWGGRSPDGNVLAVVNADLEELWCGPYLTLYKRGADNWEATRQIRLPDVSAGVPALPLSAAWDENDYLWIGDRRGRRLLGLRGAETVVRVVAAGVEPGRIVVEPAGTHLFAVDTTRAGALIFCSGLPAAGSCTSFSAQTDKSVSALALSDSTLFVSYEGGSFISRYRYESAQWQPLIAPSGALLSMSVGDMRFASDGDLLLTLPTLQRLARLDADHSFQQIAYSSTLGLPFDLQTRSDGTIIVHDRLYGDWLLNSALAVTAASGDSPSGWVTVWLADESEGFRAAAHLKDEVLTQW